MTYVKIVILLFARYTMDLLVYIIVIWVKWWVKQYIKAGAINPKHFWTNIQTELVNEYWRSIKEILIILFVYHYMINSIVWIVNNHAQVQYNLLITIVKQKYLHTPKYWHDFSRKLWQNYTNIIDKYHTEGGLS